MTAILKITDGTTEMDLLGSKGYILSSWRPATPDYKGGGVWQSSSISRGRQMVGKWFDNAAESFSLKARGVSQDILIRETQELRRLLEKASDYWVTDWQEEPVWIEAKATRETNTRYAIIHRGRIAEDDNPYSQPFLQPGCDAVMDGLTLVVERGDWQPCAPGEEECVEISGTSVWQGYGNEFFVSTQGTDDCGCSAAIIILTDPMAPFGAYPGGVIIDTGLRFRDVGIPQGAVITSAFVRMVASSNQAGAVCNADIYGQDSSFPSPFSTVADFFGRARTVARVDWDAIGAWVMGTAYDTPDISTVVQEIVDRADWASGHDLVVFLEDDGSTADAYRTLATIEHATYTEPRLYVTWTADMDWGREETCEDEVYIANKQNMAQLTHIFVDDGGAFGPNLLAEALPYNLLPAAPVNGDIVYFGIDTTVANSGPFCSLVFDIGTAATYGAGDSLDWEYWNGAWVALTVQDNTNADGTATGDTFDTAGVGSVHFEPSADWAPTVINAVNAYWVRAVLTVAAGVTTPTQQNRHPYTITWPHVEIEAAQAGGDIPPLARIRIKNQSDYGAGAAPSLYANRAMVCLRSIERGSDFTPYLNISDEQNPPFVTVTPCFGCAFVDVATRVTGRNLALAGPPAIGWNAMVLFTIGSPECQQYTGRYRVFFKGYQYSGAPGDIEIRLVTSAGGSGLLYYGSGVPFTTTSDWEVLDLGEFSLPPAGDTLKASDISVFYLYVEANGDGVAEMIPHEIALMPVDEWAGDFISQSTGFPASMGWRRSTSIQTLLDIDSVTYPKRDIRAILRRLDNTARATYRPYTGQPAMMQANAKQRYWFYLTRLEDTGEFSEPYIGSSIRVSSAQRYLSMRGDR